MGLQQMAAEAANDTRITVGMVGGVDRFVTLLREGSVEAQE
jgi:hypothetical protein